MNPKYKDISSLELNNKLDSINSSAETLRIKVLKELDDLEALYREAKEIYTELEARNNVPE